MVVALKPIHDAAGIKRATSGAGKEAMDELVSQTKSFFVNQTLDPVKFPKNIAFNVIPHIDVFMDDGSTKEEWKMVVETKKILDPKIKVHATCVRVPTFVGHAESINLELERPLDDHEARRILAAAPGVLVVDQREPGGYVTPKEITGQDGVFVSRIRSDPTVENGLAMWVVSDNLRKGAALNAVQIAEELIKGYI
jgi:aspartate-semialdehyde dehydrogenase